MGVGLRHPHYQQAMAPVANIDFVEVHAENFFMAGGASLEVLNTVSQYHPLSIHGTSLGLGSNQTIPKSAIHSLKQLVDHFKPILVSDHLCFTWSHINSQPIHSGDLLPIAFNEKMLLKASDNIKQVQDTLGQQLLAENLSAYLTMPDPTLRETDFLNQLCQNTGCKLLVDINNLMVNEVNKRDNDAEFDPVSNVKKWLDDIDLETIGEIHLAGCTEPAKGGIMVDDHSQPVADSTWQAYAYLINRLDNIPPTLIEWDTQLPEWETLVGEAEKARSIITSTQLAKIDGK